MIIRYLCPQAHRLRIHIHLCISGDHLCNEIAAPIPRNTWHTDGEWYNLLSLELDYESWFTCVLVALTVAQYFSKGFETWVTVTSFDQRKLKQFNPETILLQFYVPEVIKMSSVLCQVSCFYTISWPDIGWNCIQLRSLTLSQWSSSGIPMAIQGAWNLDPSVHWNATGESIVGSQCVSSVLPVVFQWLSSGLPVCSIYAN